MQLGESTPRAFPALAWEETSWDTSGSGRLCWRDVDVAFSVKEEVEFASSLNKLDGFPQRSADTCCDVCRGRAPREPGDTRVKAGLCLTVECSVPVKFLVLLKVMLERQGSGRQNWLRADGPAGFLGTEAVFLK